MEFLYTLLLGVSDSVFGIITQLFAVVIIFLLCWVNCKKKKALPLSIMEVGYGQPIHDESISTSENGSVPGAEDGTVAGAGIGSCYSGSRERSRSAHTDPL